MNNQVPLHTVSLRFPDNRLEASFRANYFLESAGQARMALLMGIVIYASFGLLDPWMAPAVLSELRLLRLMVCTLLLGLFAVTFTSFFRRDMQAILALASFLAGLGVAAMVGIAQNAAGYYQYYVGLMLILFFVHVLLRLRFVWATTVSWIIIGIYDAVALWIVDTPLPLFVNNNFFLIGANLSGMTASYLLERYARQVFWQTRLLKKKHHQLATEDRRKTRELETARRFQQAMLPRTVPAHPLVDLAVYTRPATEVGGDYYDFELSKDGTLTFAVGDATGHGAQASAMVTATKVLFVGLTHEADLRTVLHKASRILKRAGLGQRYMALALGRLSGTTLELAGAGMPPALLYHADSGTVEAIPLKGPPLGSFPDFPYHLTRLELAPGDTLLLMSDGLPELFSATREPFGYDRMVSLMQELMKATDDLPPDQLLDQFIEAGMAWRSSRLQNDDVTLLALRVKVDVPVAPPPHPFLTLSVPDQS